MVGLMKLNRILCWASIVIAALLAVIFALDLAVGLFFNRFSITTDIIVLIACALIIWQSVETVKEF